MNSEQQAQLEQIFDVDDALDLPSDRLDLIDKTLRHLGRYAAQIVQLDLLRYGNQITEAHARALARIISQYCFLAARLETGRWAENPGGGRGRPP